METNKIIQLKIEPIEFLSIIRDEETVLPDKSGLTPLTVLAHKLKYDSTQEQKLNFEGVLTALVVYFDEDLTNDNFDTLTAFIELTGLTGEKFKIDYKKWVDAYKNDDEKSYKAALLLRLLASIKFPFNQNYLLFEIPKVKQNHFWLWIDILVQLTRLDLAAQEIASYSTIDHPNEFKQLYKRLNFFIAEDNKQTFFSWWYHKLQIDEKKILDEWAIKRGIFIDKETPDSHLKLNQMETDFFAQVKRSACLILN